MCQLGSSLLSAISVFTIDSNLLLLWIRILYLCHEALLISEVNVDSPFNMSVCILLSGTNIHQHQVRIGKPFRKFCHISVIDSRFNYLYASSQQT